MNNTDLKKAIQDWLLDLDSIPTQTRNIYERIDTLKRVLRMIDKPDKVEAKQEMKLYPRHTAAGLGIRIFGSIICLDFRDETNTQLIHIWTNKPALADIIAVADKYLASRGILISTDTTPASKPATDFGKGIEFGTAEWIPIKVKGKIKWVTLSTLAEAIDRMQNQPADQIAELLSTLLKTPGAIAFIQLEKRSLNDYEGQWLVWEGNTKLYSGTDLTRALEVLEKGK
jgi:preprotein translocase subunit Sss1